MRLFFKHENASGLNLDKIIRTYLVLVFLSVTFHHMLAHAATSTTIAVNQIEDIPSCFNSGSYQLNINPNIGLPKINIEPCPNQTNINITIDGSSAGTNAKAGVYQRALFPQENRWERVESLAIESRMGTSCANGKCTLKLPFNVPVYKISLQNQPAPNILLQDYRQARLARHPNGQPLTWEKSKFGMIKSSSEWVANGSKLGAVTLENNADNPAMLLWNYSVGNNISSSHPSVDFFIRSNDWHMASRRVFWLENQGLSAAFYGPLITEISPTLPNPNPDYVSNGFGLIGVNSIVFLDEAGEFFWDSNSKFLYYAPLDGVDLTKSENAKLMSYIPEKTITEGMVRGKESSGIFIYLDPTSTVTIKNLYVSAISGTGITTWNTSLNLDNVEIYQTSDFGVASYGFSPTNTPHLNIYKSKIVETGDAGLSTYNNSVSISESEFNDSGLLRAQKFDLTRIKDDNYLLSAGISMHSSNIAAGELSQFKVSNSKFSASAYASIELFGSNGPVEIKQNTFSNYCMQLNDCGAMHISDFIDSTGSQQQVGKIIYGNNIYPGKSVPEGGTGFLVAPGIYLDRATGFYTIQNNYIEVNSEFGAIYLHGGNSNNIFSNWIVNKNGPGLYMCKHPNIPANPNTGTPYIALKMNNNAVYSNWIQTTSSTKSNLGEVWFRQYTSAPAPQSEIASFGYFTKNNNSTPLKGTSSGNIVYTWINGVKVMNYNGKSVIPFQ